MAKTSEFSPFFQRIIESPETAIAAMRENPAEFEAQLMRFDQGEHVAQAALPNRFALAFALFDAGGNAIALDSPDWLQTFATKDELLQHVDARSGDGRLLCIAQDDGSSTFGLWAPYAESVSWNLPLKVRRLAEARKAASIALFACGAAAGIEDAASAFGLPPFQQRVVGAVTQAGSLKRAAEQLGISYAAAREAMAAATRRMQLPNTPAVVQAVVAAAFGILPSDVTGSVLLADALSVTERQARVALMIASGSSREATALALGTSPSVVRKELQNLFATLGVQSATELARLITEMQALRMFARSIDNAPGFLDPAIEPSRYSIRPNDHGLIGWSDYGPASGKPVLVVHSNWCCRAVPTPLVRALQKKGWRPIAIDRPGFGPTHLGSASREDTFGQAIDDTLQIMAQLKIGQIPIIARCGAQFVHAFAAREPDRVGPVVLVSPTPQTQESGKRSGPVGAFKEAFFRSPRLIEFFFRVISAQFSFERVEQLMRSLTRSSPTDRALCDDPQFIRDRFRALRPFACGRYAGGILEEMVISHGGHRFDPLPSADWTILQGAEDYQNDFDETAEYWRGLLPEATIELVEGAGRFMTSSHPALVVDRLERIRKVTRGG